MKKYYNILFIIAIIVLFGTSSAFAKTNKVGIACTEEAKACADGSFVGRTGPDCEFAKCPGDGDRFLERDAGMVKNTAIDTTINNVKEEIKTEKEKIKNQIEKIREETKQKIDDLKTKILSEKNKIKAKIEEKRITGREDALKRFDIAITKLDTLKNNVNEKITKFDTQEINTEKAKAQILIADEKIAEIKTKVSEASTLLSLSLNELTKENKTKLKQLTKDTQTLVKEAHLALNEAVKSLKEELKNKVETVKSTNVSVDDTKTDSTNKEVKE